MLQEVRGSEMCPLHQACSKQLKPSQGDALLLYTASLYRWLLEEVLSPTHSVVHATDLAISNGGGCSSSSTSSGSNTYNAL